MGSSVRTVTREPHNVHFDFDPRRAAAAEVDPGGIVRLQTVDAAAGQLRPGVTAPFDRARVNPVTGPVAVRGVRPGDLVRVQILDIELPDVGYMWVRPGLGFRLGVEQPVALAVALDRARGEGRLLGTRQGPAFPLHPHVGAVGVAPADGPVASRWPGDHGGNMDCASTVVGASVWLPAACAGGLVSLGDVHAAMGDGEVGGTGVEVDATVTVRLDAFPAPAGQAAPLRGPVVETAEGYELFGHGETVEEAAEMAMRRAHRLLCGQLGLTAAEGFMLLSAACHLRFCQVALARAGAAMRVSRRLVPVAPPGWDGV